MFRILPNWHASASRAARPILRAPSFRAPVRGNGFEGKLTTSKWAKLAKCSQDTEYRDILDLVERGALRKGPGGGRSTSYSLAIDS